MMHSKKIITKFILLVAALVTFFTGPQDVFSKIIIIANRSVEETTLRQGDLKSIYLGEQSVWKDDKRINFAILRKGSAHQLFLNTYIHKTPKNFIRYWKRQIMTGKAVIPKLATTEKEVIEYVAITEGAIGYVSDTLNDPDVKVIKIIK